MHMSRFDPPQYFPLHFSSVRCPNTRNTVFAFDSPVPSSLEGDRPFLPAANISSSARGVSDVLLFEEGPKALDRRRRVQMGRSGRMHYALGEWRTGHLGRDATFRDTVATRPRCYNCACNE